MQVCHHVQSSHVAHGKLTDSRGLAPTTRLNCRDRRLRMTSVRNSSFLSVFFIVVISYDRFMEITDKNLEAFRRWIVGRGRSPDTAALYSYHLAACAADDHGITHRLVLGSLSPNTRHGIMAALRAWARYSKDTELAQNLADIRLPTARRIKHKSPLSYEDWKTAVTHLRRCRMTNDPLRQVLILLATRGFRSGDVLRMRRTELARALDTGKLVYVAKGDRRQEFSVEPIREPLERLLRHKDWQHVRDLVTTSKNPKVARNKVYRASRRTAKKAGILEMNPHRYRHTFATNFLNQIQGDPNAIVKLQKYMGWSNMATAAVYVDAVSQEHLDEIGSHLIDGILKAEPGEPEKRRRRRQGA